MSEQPQPPKEAAFFTAIRSWGLVRGTSGVVGGVVEGVGNRIGLARVPARLLVVVAWLLLPGIVMLAYAAGWALLPDHRGNIIIQNFGRGVTNVGALIGIAVLTLLGLLGFDNGPIFNVLLGNGGFYLWDDFVHNGFVPRVAVVLVPVFFFLAIVTGIVVFIVWLAKRSNSSTADAPVTPTPPVASASGNGSTPSSGPQGSGAPQPWEPALLPGDPRAGASASSSTRRASANAAHTAGAQHTSTGQAGPASAGAAAPPPAPAPPARPPAPTVPGPGQGAYLAFVAVLLLAAAATALLAREDMLVVSPLLAWGAAITVGLGAILFIVALAGRKLGFLGFLSVFAVILAVLFSGNAEQIRDSYSYEWSWDDEIVYDEEVTVHEYEDEVFDTFDLTAELGTHYSAIFIAGTCMSPNSEMTWDDVRHQGASMASMRLDAVEDDMDIDLAATFTRLAIPAGTSLEVVGTGANNVVVWEDRDASCASWNYGYDYEYDESGQFVEPELRPLLSATNPDAPVLTINVGADKSIYIEEVAK